MKIVFDKLQTQKETISIKFSDTYTQEVNVNDAVENGVHINPDNCSDLDHITIENSIKPLHEGLNDKFKAIKRYVSVKFEELNSYLQNLEDNTPETSYKIKVTDIPESTVGWSDDVGTLGYILIANKTKYINLKFDHSLDNVTDATRLFSGCSNLTEIDTTPFTNVTNANTMFNSCINLTEINTSGFTNVTNASCMFFMCRGLTTIDTSSFTNVTNAYGMFAHCGGLANIDTTPFTNVTNAESMFQNCAGLTSIDTSGFTKVTNARAMFAECVWLTSIDTSAFTNVTDAEAMFMYCRGLTEIDTSGFTNVTTVRYMFYECLNLTEIDTTPFTNVTNAGNMFYGCRLTAYYGSEEDNIYKNYKSIVGGNITWTLK